MYLESEFLQRGLLQFFESILNLFGYTSTLLVFREFKEQLEELFGVYAQLHNMSSAMSSLKSSAL